MSDAELERQYKVTDQMISIYSVLRDRYARRALWLTLGIFGCSVILCAATFLPDEALNSIGITSVMSKVILGAVSSTVLFLSIAELRVDWKERSRRYGDASDRLSILKAHLRSALARDDKANAERSKELSEQYALTFENLPGIHDRQFAKLKAYHLRKVCISQMIDRAPGCPIWFHRLRLLYEGFKQKKK